MTTELTKAAQQALEACPFCGGKNIKVHSYSDAVIGGEPDAFAQCHDCSVTGPNGKTEAEAAQAWNTRALTQRPAAQTEREADGYGSTDLPWSFTVCRELEPQEKRLMSMLVSAFGSDHPAIDDMAHLILNRPASLPAQPAAQATPAQDVGASADYWGDLAQQKADADARRGVSMPVSYYTSSIVGALLATQQAAPEPVGEVYGWAVTGLSFIWRGEHAQACAEQEAKTCGGTSIAFPLFTHPAPGVPEDVLSVCAKVADSPEVEEALCHYIKEESDTHTIAWLIEVILKQALAAAQAKGGEHA